MEFKDFSKTVRTLFTHPGIHYNPCSPKDKTMAENFRHLTPHSNGGFSQSILKMVYGITKHYVRQGRGGGGGRGRDEVWDQETMFSQLGKRSPCVVVSR